jgi:membrane protein insertase Oxa1/YidC/SpoIIIJ
MIDLLYNIIIFPLVKIIELNYLFISRLFHNPAVSLLGVNLSINILTLPLYFCAEKWQNLERETQKRLSGKIAHIKKAFSGDEQYMILSTYYRQNHYHPVYALRSSFSLLIQIPFFIAAYSFLSNYEVLDGLSFWFISDLSRPDNLLFAGGGGINLLPFIMTLINVVSCAVYAGDFSLRDKIQLYGIAAVFLVLLYNSPAGLVIYWTVNNIFSLIKNILQKIRHSKRIVYFLICFFVFFLDIYLLFIHQGYIIKRIIVILTVSVLFLLPLLKKIFLSVNKKITGSISPEPAKNQNGIFIFAAVSLFLLTGFVIPASLIASSVPEFSFIENNTSPFPFLFTALSQAAGIFLFWPLCIYFFFSKRVKVFITSFAVFLCLGMLINVFLFPGSYGFLTNTLILSNPGTWASNFSLKLFNIAVLIVLIPLLFFLFSSQKRKNILLPVEIISFAALLCFGSSKAFTISRDFQDYPKEQMEEGHNKNLTPVYNLSSAGRNVVIIMLDRALSCFCSSIFEEKPELHRSWSGFTYYPNCAAFSGWTLFGVPSLTGGYFYTPLNMQDNPKPLVEKNNEALLLLPRIFAGTGYKTSITDPSYANYGWSPDLSIFDPYPEIHAENINSAYVNYWTKNHPDVEVTSVAALLKERLILFSLFKTAPLILRTFIYDRGDWLTVNNRDKKEGKNELTLKAIGNYAVLDYLPKLTNIDSHIPGNIVMIFNEITHDPVFLQSPDYVPVSTVNDKGNGIFSDNPHYHVNMAAYLLLGKWFDYLKKNSVYDNTRIIVVSDHGANTNIDSNGFDLLNGNRLEKYTSLLMVKDFYSRGDINIDNTFMTQADVPILALHGIINYPVNPFTGLPIKNEKDNGVFITTSDKFYYTKHGKYKFNINRDEWLFVHDNIFDPDNWEKAEK